MNDWFPADKDHLPQPLEVVEVNISATRKKQQCVARKWDSRIWKAMTHMEQEAAQQIAWIVNQYSGVANYKVQKLSGTPPSTAEHDDTRLATMREYYNTWLELCRRYRVCPTSLINIIVLGHSLSRVDRNKRKRKGWAKQNMLDGLGLYCEVRGW